MDWKNIRETHAKRKSQTISSLFDSKGAQNAILLSPSDLGVCLNGGRRGASLAPKALVAALSKLTLTNGDASQWKEVLTSNPQDEEKDFSKSQMQSASLIETCLDLKKLLHLGGGHDHVYPLLKALNKKYPSINIINIDAHLDTRQEKFSHSGTPFRQFLKESKDSKILQIGIHDYANAPSNYEGIDKDRMKVITCSQCSSFSSIEDELKEFTRNDNFTLLSLDADALHSSTMEAVSAVNHHGLSLEIVQKIFDFYYEISQEQKAIGVYEYNPIYDNLSQKGARALSSLLYHFF